MKKIVSQLRDAICRYIYIQGIGANGRLKQKQYQKNNQISIGNNVQIFPEAELQHKSKGKITVGNNTAIRGVLQTFPHGGNINIGTDCYIGDHTRIWASKEIIIGNRVLISHNCNIFDSTTHPMDKNQRYLHYREIILHGLPEYCFPTTSESPVIIEDDVWIGCSCIILKGVTIGSGSIIGAGSVVTKTIPPNVMVAGNPARVIKTLEEFKA